LLKWDGKNWLELDTKEDGKDATFHYFIGTTNSFSPFAIVNLKSRSFPAFPPMAAPTKTPELSPNITTTSQQPPGIIMKWWSISSIFAILVVATILSYFWIHSSLKIVMEQTSVQADGKSTIPVKVQFVNTFGKTRKSPKDRDVKIIATSGEIENVVIPAFKGSAQTTLKSSNECGPVTITAISNKNKASVKVTFLAGETSRCIYCGKEVYKDEKFCESCGKPLRS
jgi:hypothetical protein